jgi:RNA polymerase sigma-70 factor (ECF subfamily)
VGLLSLIYRQIRALRPHAADIDDLVQTAAEQALRALPSFERRSKLSTWTYRICYLTLLKHERWYRRWLRRFALTVAGELPESATADHAAGVELELRERAARLHVALGQLSPKRRTVLVLHDLEGLTIDEVALVVSANPRTVRSRLRDARTALARLLAKDPYFGESACQESS